MSNWRPVDVRLWNDRRFLACGDRGRMLWLFLLTCPSLPIPGVVVGGDAALAEQLGWTTEGLREGFHELAQNGLRVRREARILWLPNALKYQPCAGPNAIKCWGKKWDDVPEGELKLELWEALRIACKSWSVLFGKLFPKPFQEPIREPIDDGSPRGSTHKHQHDHKNQHDHDPEKSSLPRAIPHQVPQLAVPGPIAVTVAELAAAIPPGESAWHRRQRWWNAMLEADRRIRAAGIEPNAPSLPKAPAGANEQNMARCERQLLDGGASPDEVDAKMRHIVLVAEAEALREGHRRWFKPAMIWDPARAARAVDTSLDEAKRPRPSKAAQDLARRFGSTGPAPLPGAASRRSFDAPPPATTLSTEELLKLAAGSRAELYGSADGARAPPASAGPHDDTPTDEKPRRKARA